MWRVEDQRATFASASLSWQVRMDRPEFGLSDILVARRPLPGARLLQLHTTPGPLPEQIADHYIRQNDLIVTYEQLPPRTVRPQIYWRAVVGQAAGEEVRGVELIVSVQTDLLDSHPQTRIASQLASDEALTGNAAGVLSRQRLRPGERVQLTGTNTQPFALIRLNDEFSYLEMTYPGDFTTASVTRAADGSNLEVTWELFHEHLEKGVIRRARLRGFFVPRKYDEACCTPLLDAFAGSELPLTT